MANRGDPLDLENPPSPIDPFWDDFEPDEMIMEATVWVLAEEGYSGLTLRKVAERAGKNRGLIHYYFESKHDLLLSLCDHILDGMKRLIRINEEADSSDQLWTALQFFAYGPGGVDEHGRHYQMAISQLQALAAHDPALRRRLTRNYHYTVELTAAIIEDGIKEGRFHSVDPDVTAVFLIATIDGARNTDLTLNTETAREAAFDAIDQYISERLSA
jgi:AcrR family transcriptional regulator